MKGPALDAVELGAEDGGRATLVPVHARPGARRAGLVGLHGRALKLATRAPAEDGRANEELLALVARLFGLRPSAVALVRGHSSRAKLFRVELAPDEARRRLRALSP